MSTVTKYTLNGQETQPFREALDVTISAVFGLEPQPTISVDTVTFVDTDKAKNSAKVRGLWEDNPVEGAPFSIGISGEDDAGNPLTIDFPFYLDYTRMKFLSDVETTIGLTKESSLSEFNFRAQGITQRLLEFKELLNAVDFQNAPYVVENRKTLLERINLLFQGFIMLKMIADETHKIINIASDVPNLNPGAIIAASFQIGTTIAAVVVQFIALKNLLEQIQVAFFPIVLYHSAIKPATFLRKAVQFMGYDDVEFGTLTDIMDELTWLGSKNNQKGIPANSPNPNSGILQPKDVGYNLFDAKELNKEQFRCREAVIDNVYHLRPEKDPFWVNASSYVMPSVLIEQTFASNGTIRPNYEDLNSSTIIQYATDDSDLWTLNDLADEEDELTTGKIIAVTTVEPIVVGDQRKVLLKGSKNINIPYALAVRKDEVDDLFDLFTNLIVEFGEVREEIEVIIDSFLDASAPVLEAIIPDVLNRTGALKVENDFFSVPKMMLLTDNSQGNPRIREDFADIIGAKALYQDFHSYDSFIEGQRNPDDPNETAAKLIHEDVRIPFGLADFDNIQNNGYFTTDTGKIGKFDKVDWNVRGDFAITTFWIYDNWMSNIEENIA